MHESPTEGGVVELGSTMTGWFSDSDPILAQGRRGQTWTVEGRGGETYTIDLMADGYDPVMLDPRTDNDGGVGLNARLTVTLPEIIASW